jgi:hypothetical protein
MAKTNLDFHGSSCTKDCSGHKAGWDWQKKNPGKMPVTQSQSFVNGAMKRSTQLQAGRDMIAPSIRDTKTGKFTKFNPIK